MKINVKIFKNLSIFILFGMLLMATITSCGKGNNNSSSTTENSQSDKSDSSLSNSSSSSQSESSSSKEYFDYSEGQDLGQTISVINDEYATIINGKYTSIFDNNKIKELKEIEKTYTRDIRQSTTSSTSIEGYVENLKIDYQSKLKFGMLGIIPDLDIPMLFGHNIENNISSKLGYNKTSNTKEIWAHLYYYNVKEIRNFTDSTNLNDFRNCLSQEFLNEVQSIKTNTEALEVLNKYGTHVVTGGYYGGKLDFTYLYYYNLTNTTEEIEYNEDFNSKFQLEFLNLLNFGTSLSANFKLSDKLFSEKINGTEKIDLNYKGGKSLHMGTLNALHDNINEWSMSLEDESNNVLIDFVDNSLIAIWDLLPDTDAYASCKKLLIDECAKRINEDYISLMASYGQTMGSKDNPFLINSIDDVKAYTKFDSQDTYYSLETDLDLTTCREFINTLHGNFDGNNHTLKNFNYIISAAEKQENTNFGIIRKNEGVISNLIVENVIITTNEAVHKGDWINVGGLIGENCEKGRIENVIVKNSNFTLNRSGSRLGGITGLNEGSIINCKVESSHFFSNGDCGGIAGKNSNILENVSFVGSNTSNLNNPNFEYWYVKYNKDRFPNAGNKSFGAIVGYNANNSKLNSFSF